MRAPLLAALTLICACGTDAPPYASCGEGGDCGDGSDGCYSVMVERSDGTEETGALCTRACEVDDDCPGEGVCLALAGDPAATQVCWATCDVSLDCYAGFRCTGIDGAPGVASICLP